MPERDYHDEEDDKTHDVVDREDDDHNDNYSDNLKLVWPHLV